MKSVQSIVSVINRRLKGRREPLVVALDGGSGAGKSTLADGVSSRLEAAVIRCDDFFDATIADEEWDKCTPEEKCRRCIDWNRVRKEALVPLMKGNTAQYRPYSFTSANGLAPGIVEIRPAAVILLDGIYSARPEMSDLVDLAILVDAAPELRHRRHNLRERSDDADWHERWDPAEAYYFSVLRPRSSFDIIVENEEDE